MCVTYDRRVSPKRVLLRLSEIAQIIESRTKLPIVSGSLSQSFGLILLIAEQLQRVLDLLSALKGEDSSVGDPAWMIPPAVSLRVC